jgi:Ribonuclease HepT-like
MTPRRLDPSVVQARLSVMRGAPRRRPPTARRHFLSESFELAEGCGLIDKQLCDDLLPSVGMHNILVHEYLEIDLRRVAVAVPPRALCCYRRYVQQVAEFVSRIS